MTSHPVNSKVKVKQGIDETFDQSYMGMEGVVIYVPNNGITRTLDKHALHTVKFDLNTVPKDHPDYNGNAYMIESFWYSELEEIK